VAEFLPEDLLLRCFRPLAAMGAHSAVSASCRALGEVARDDRLWAERLARDFPLASRAKPPGTLHRVYRMLAKSQLSSRRRGLGIGPAAVFGAIAGMAPPSVATDAQEPLLRSAEHQKAIKSLAARFHAVNASIEEHVPVRTTLVVWAQPGTRPEGRPRGPPPPRRGFQAPAEAPDAHGRPGQPSRTSNGTAPGAPPTGTLPDVAALFADIRARRVED